MRERVLLATDLGPDAVHAIRLADEWAHEHRASLEVLQVVEGTRGATPLAVARELRARVAEVVRRVAEFSIAVETGDPAAVILSRALTAGLLVIGAPARPSRWGARAVAERILAAAPCPVLVARRGPPSGRILFATDFTDPGLPAVAAAAEIARRRAARLTGLHAVEDALVVTPPGSSGFAWPMPVGEELARTERRLATSLARFGASGTAVATAGPPALAILAAAATLAPELVVVGSHGRRGLRRLFHRNVAAAVAWRARSPVLVVPLRDAMRSVVAAANG